MVESLRKVRHARLDEEPAVWQRAILRGERCSPLSFRGLILYDENGNQLPTTFNEDSETEPESPPALKQLQIETPFGSRNGTTDTSFDSRNGTTDTSFDSRNGTIETPFGSRNGRSIETSFGSRNGTVEVETGI